MLREKKSVKTVIVYKLVFKLVKQFSFDKIIDFHIIHEKKMEIIVVEFEKCTHALPLILQ